ncbi:MAG: phosphate signaling complex protein PhoU [Acidobacteriota bacterium]
METHFHEQLNALRERLLWMASLAERMIKDSVQALVLRNDNLRGKVFELESEVNLLHVEIDDRCCNLLALHQPVASDLRTIIAALKICSDLERIGDQAVNIAEQAQVLIHAEPVKPLIDIPRMSEITQRMVKDAIDSFVNGDADTAQRILLTDDQVDELKEQIFRELLTYIMQDPATTPRALALLLISRSLERVADHATNIAEDVIFMIKAKDIRHHAGGGAAPGSTRV